MALQGGSAVGGEALAGRQAEEAIAVLLDQHGDQVFRASLKFCGNPADADDLVQETFLQAYRHWDQFEGR